MFLNLAKVISATTLLIGAAQAQENTAAPPSSPGQPIPYLKGTPPSTQPDGWHVVVPESSVPKPEDAGTRAHTHYRLLVPNVQPQEPPQAQAVSPNVVVGSPFPGFLFETPASLACIYILVTPTIGCNPNTVTTVSTRGSKVIAIVDAFHNSSALADLQKFSAQFGLPAPTSANFQIVFASGSPPPADFGWAGEEALDIQMAHALAPHAKIILVEANSASDTDLLQAEDKASALVAAAGGGEVSNSWGGSEFSTEGTFDTHFATAKVVYFASTGDNPGVEWPSISAKVVAVGGTSTSRSNNTGGFFGEASWQDGGGGQSAFVTRPAYQNAISAIVGARRGVPDISADAYPYTGVWIVCGTGCGAPAGSWNVIGGTSVASPLVAAMVNAAGGFAASSAAELTKVYAGLGTTKFYDIKRGICGHHAGFQTTGGTAPAVTAWDFCTGVGSPHGLSGL